MICMMWAHGVQPSLAKGLCTWNPNVLTRPIEMKLILGEGQRQKRGEMRVLGKVFEKRPLDRWKTPAL